MLTFRPSGNAGDTCPVVTMDYFSQLESGYVSMSLAGRVPDGTGFVSWTLDMPPFKQHTAVSTEFSAASHPLSYCAVFVHTGRRPRAGHVQRPVVPHVRECDRQVRLEGR